METIDHYRIALDCNKSMELHAAFAGIWLPAGAEEVVDASSISVCASPLAPKPCPASCFAMHFIFCCQHQSDRPPSLAATPLVIVLIWYTSIAATLTKKTFYVRVPGRLLTPTQ
jgi:hypothetical protein